MATGVNDKYANIASASVTFDGATVAFTEVQTGISLGQGMGMVIDAIEYYFPPGDLDGLTTAQELILAWTTANTLTELRLSKNQIIHLAQKSRVDLGTAASGLIDTAPQMVIFSPPLIIAAPRVYFAAWGPAGAAGIGMSRLYFRYIKLSAQEYLELAETFLLVG